MALPVHQGVSNYYAVCYTLKFLAFTKICPLEKIVSTPHTYTCSRETIGEMTAFIPFIPLYLAMHKTPLLIIRLCLIFEILSRKVTSVSLRDVRSGAGRRMRSMHGKRCYCYIVFGLVFRNGYTRDSSQVLIYFSLNKITTKRACLNNCWG